MTERDPLAELARLIGDNDPRFEARLFGDRRKPYSIHDRHRDMRKLRRARRINIVMMSFLFSIVWPFDIIWHGFKGAYQRAIDIRDRIRRDWNQ